MKLRYGVIVGAVAGLLLLLVCSIPALAIESGLLGVPIYSTPDDLTRAYGTPWGVVMTSGGRLYVHRTLTWREQEDVRLGLGRPRPQPPPAWARPVLPARLTGNQQVWLYRLYDGDVSAAFVIRGLGEEAVVTDIIAFAEKPHSQIRTERGIALGDSFTQLLLTYNYPPLIQPFGRSRSGAGAGNQQRAAGGPARTGGMPRGGGGMPRGGMRFGGGAGGRAPAARGTGPVPTLGAGRSDRGRQSVTFNQRAVSFSKDCVILYDGIAFTLHDFKVIRIQVTQ